MERHLDPETAYRFAEDALSTEERARVREHLDRCGECRAEVQMARDFATTSVQPLDADSSERLRSALSIDEGPGASVRRAKTSAPRRSRPWLLRGLAAAGIAVVAFGVWQLRTPGPGPGQGTLRGEGEIRWGLSVRADVQGWDVHWEAQPRVDRYDVALQASSGRTVWRGQTESSSLRIEAAQLDTDLRPDDDYFVSVSFRVDGATQSSPPVSLPRID